LYVHVNYSIRGWVGASNNDPAQGLHTLKSRPVSGGGSKMVWLASAFSSTYRYM